MNLLQRKLFIVSLLVGLSNIHASMPPELEEEYQQPMPAVGSAVPIQPQPQVQATGGLQWQPEEAEEESIQTGTYERQNWYRTKIFFGKAKKMYDELVKVVDVINESKTAFFEEQRKVSAELGKFYITYGFQGGEIDEQNTILLAQINELREKRGMLIEQQRMLLAELNEKNKELEQLKADLLMLHDLEKSLEEGFSLVLKQADLARSYQEKALNNYEQISEAPNDEVAEKLYREMESFAHNVKASQEYVQGAFAEFFHKTIDLINTSVEKIKKRVAELKERGILLVKEVKEVSKEVVQEPVKEKAPQTWSEKIGGWFKTLWGYITMPFKAIYHWFVPEEQVAKKPKKGAEVTEELVTNSLQPIGQEQEQKIPPIAPVLPILPTTSEAELVPAIPVIQPESKVSTAESRIEPFVTEEIPVQSPKESAPKISEEPAILPEPPMQGASEQPLV
ncbi:MAG: hypothetical protein WA432_00530 [Candidatus Babeliaceae bacterium]